MCSEAGTVAKSELEDARWPALSDEQCMTRLAAGDSEALDALYQRYARKLHVFFSRTVSPHQAEDLVHDVFLKVVESAGGFDPARGPFRTWIFRIARNRGIDRMRRESTLKIRSLEGTHAPADAAEAGPAVPEVTTSDPGDEAVLAASDVTARIRDCLEALDKDEERQALVLYYLGEKVFREVGAILGKSTSMAQKWVRKAKEKMRRCLERKGIAA